MSTAKTMNSKKRKLPKSFLECPSLSLVADFPSSLQQETNNESSSTAGGGMVVSTNVATDTVKEIFLERLIKEIVTPFRPSNKPTTKEDGHDGKTFVMVNGKLQEQAQKPLVTTKSQRPTTKRQDNNSVWNQRLIMGTNQCQRILERTIQGDDPTAPLPALVVLARDIYPPTMLASVPVMAKRLGIPILLLPGKASNELGQALGIKKASILVFLQSPSTSSDHSKVNSFLEFVSSEMINTKTASRERGKDA